MSCSESAIKDSIQQVYMSRQTTLKGVADKIIDIFQIPTTLDRPTRFLFRSCEENVQSHQCEISDTVTLNNSGYGFQDVLINKKKLHFSGVFI